MTEPPASRLAYTRGLHPINVRELATAEFPPISQLLAPILPEKAIAMVYGPRGIGKTYITLGIAVAVAAGASFLRWQAPKPRSVLVIDGEMPIVTLQERLKEMPGIDALMDHPDRLRLLAADYEPDGLPDLGDLASHCYFEDAVREAELILVDNISTICRTVRENDADSWLPVQEWALRMKRMGKTVVFIHHSGKGGSQRGTSRKEDVLNTIVALKKPHDYAGAHGARFEIHFEKHRGFFGTDAEPFEAWLRNGEWQTDTIKKMPEDDIRRMSEAGLSVRDIAEKTGIPKSTVDRRLKKKGHSSNGKLTQ